MKKYKIRISGSQTFVKLQVTFSIRIKFKNVVLHFATDEAKNAKQRYTRMYVL